MNHMVALYVRRDSATGRINGRLVDYQMNLDDPRRIASQIPHSGKYYIFDTEKLFPSMHDDL
jgi:predicted transglutaminase-like protease